jgi:hypothetical protein|eukprot:SAG25_NODE_17_length_24192_cov_70.399452_22_plen_142_part_00
MHRPSAHPLTELSLQRVRAAAAQCSTHVRVASSVAHMHGGGGGTQDVDTLLRLSIGAATMCRCSARCTQCLCSQPAPVDVPLAQPIQQHILQAEPRPVSTARCTISGMCTRTPHIEAPWAQNTGWCWGSATTAPQCAGSIN